MANILLDIEKGVEVAAQDVYNWVTSANAKVQSGGPSGLAALGVLAGAIDKAVTDVASDATNPTQITVTLPSTVADFKTVWTDAKAVLATLGIKV